ncbi:ABC transporter ATP-binding protein/permease [Candidatus Pelagibacter sp.]|jgi:ATP-binding cassette, subfamily B, bacterial PglK|nr:ABC transporter ATP-binding protein/permease [Candidatus Pelagibacter sp.]
MQIIKKVLFLFTQKEKFEVSVLLVMILIMALLDMIGVASILPFMAIVTNPSLIETNIILKSVFQFSKTFGVENYQQFIFALGFMVFFMLVISLAFKAFTTFIQVRFVQMREYSISSRLVEGYLHQPYSWFLSRHSADLGKTILSVVKEVIGNGVNPLMELVAKSIVAITLIALLIITDPKLALIVGLSISLIYTFIFFFFRNFLNRIGKERLKSDQQRFTSISEAFGASKEVKVGGLEEVYIKKYSESAKIFAQNQAQSVAISQIPRFIIEALAFGGIMLIILYMMTKTGSFNDALPIISLYVFAGYRLMPALQQIYVSFTQLTFIGPSIDALNNDIKKLKQLNSDQAQGTLQLKKEITLKDVYYNYPNSSRTALKRININIPVKSTVGLIGATGCGKTTTVDIILGLLEPQKGTLEVDGQIITEKNSRAWQRSIGYVPQHIYLADDTIEANIAFGIDHKDINQKVIEKVSKIANLHDFVTNELTKKYQTIIGERGVRLSGGQRQRIGIARALYHNPQVLVLDEATSSLDNQTEQVVMEAVNNISKDITIILIAHRLNTVKDCNIIFKLEKGEVVEQKINKY